MRPVRLLALRLMPLCLLPILLVTLLLVTTVGCRSRSSASPPAPVIASVSPNSGPRSGGTLVDIKGSGFGTQPFVTFGAANVTAFQSASDTEIVLVTPTSASGPAAVTVVNLPSGGQQTLLDAFYFMPLAPQGHDARYYPSALTGSGATLVMVTGTGQSLSGLTLTVPASAAGSIAGLLTEKGGGGGLPLVGHPVLATRTDGTLPAVPMPAGVDGRYLIGGLPAGSYFVQSQEPPGSSLANQAWNQAFRLGSALPVEVVAGQVSGGIDLALPVGGTITGTVLAAGSAQVGAAVWSVDDSAGSLGEAGAICVSGGGYSLTGLAPGGYRLEATASPDLVTTWWPSAFGEETATVVAVSGSGAITADFHLALGGSIGGLVIEEGSARPLPGVRVVSSDASLAASISAVSDSDGSYLLPGLPAGSYRLQAAELGQFYDAVTSSSSAEPVLVASGQSVGEINWVGTIDPPPACGNPSGTGSVSGVVEGPAGLPVLRAAVLVSGTAGQGSATSGAEGQWTVDCLPPGNYLATVHAPGSNLAAQQVAVTVQAQASAEADTTLTPGASLAGMVRDQATGAPLRGVPIAILNEITGESAQTITLPDGTWSIDRFSSGGLDLGSYRIEAKSSVQLDPLGP